MLKYHVVFLFLFCLPSVHSQLYHSETIYKFDLSYEISDTDTIFYTYSFGHEYVEPRGGLISNIEFPFQFYPPDVVAECNNEILDYSSKGGNNKYSIFNQKNGKSQVVINYASPDETFEINCDIRIRLRDTKNMIQEIDKDVFLFHSFIHNTYPENLDYHFNLVTVPRGYEIIDFRPKEDVIEPLEPNSTKWGYGKNPIFPTKSPPSMFFQVVYAKSNETIHSYYFNDYLEGLPPPIEMIREPKKSIFNGISNWFFNLDRLYKIGVTIIGGLSALLIIRQIIKERNELKREFNVIITKILSLIKRLPQLRKPKE
jgi:hypothetical protein